MIVTSLTWLLFSVSLGTLCWMLEVEPTDRRPGGARPCAYDWALGCGIALVYGGLLVGWWKLCQVGARWILVTVS